MPCNISINLDPAGYSSGKTMSIPADGVISEMLKKYKEKFGLKDVEFGIKIYPIDLQTGESIKHDRVVGCQRMSYNGTKYVVDTSTKCPSDKVLTRPRFGKAPADSEIPEYLKIIGNPNIGFEVRVNFEYTRNEQTFSCDAMHKFNHGIKPIIKESPLPNLEVTVTELRTGAGRDLKTDPLKVSCDTDDKDKYDDIIVGLDFSGVEGRQVGTVILCRMNSYCRSFGDDGDRNGCSPVEDAPWQRCHDIKPKQGSDQSWTLKLNSYSSSALNITFENMKPNRRYDLHVGEFSMAGNLISINRLFSADPTNPDENFVFYLDNTRPTIGQRRIRWNAVGLPSDGIKGRLKGPRALISAWIPPQNSDADKWLQCATDDNVHFQAQVEDQFTHNITGCPDAGKKGIIGTREDGSGPTNVTVDSGCIEPRTWTCCDKNGDPYCHTPADSGSLSGPQCNGVVKKGNIEHGRHTITFTPSDTCGQANASWDLVWDTDLPGTFDGTKGFKEEKPVRWFKKSDGPAYVMKTEIPAADDAGKFPKHYTVDCEENYIGNEARMDGNSGQLECILELPANPNDDDGCNPSTVGVQYYHICGGVGDCNKQKWAVYASENEFCADVLCEPTELLCCQSSSIYHCGSSNNKCLKRSSYPKFECAKAKDGDQDNTSGCPHLGLYDCDYKLYCATGEKGDCGSKRITNKCEYTVTDYNDCDQNGVCATSDEEGACFNTGRGCREKSQPNTQNYKCSERKPLCL